MKKTITLLMVTCLLVMAVFAGCGSNSNDGTGKQPATADIAQKLLDGIAFDDELIQLEGDRMTTQYDEINADDLEEYTVYVSSSGATPEEVAVFKLKEDGDAQALEDAIDSRVQERPFCRLCSGGNAKAGELRNPSPRQLLCTGCGRGFLRSPGHI